MSILDNAPTAYTFDDFFLAPAHSEIRSRKDPDTSIQLGDIPLSIPIVASPMNTVTEVDMAVTMARLGGVGVIHRYMSIEDQVNQAQSAIAQIATTTQVVNSSGSPNQTPSAARVFCAIGANGDSIQRAEALWGAGVRSFCIDVANGHSVHCVEAVARLRARYPEAHIMAGNVCTYDGTRRLAEAGANSIRVGIGPGCFAQGTRVLMGSGVYKNIEHIQPGDMVINKDGRAVKVLKAWCTGTRKVMSLRHTQFYKKTFCTADHRYWVGDLSRLAPSTVSSRGYAKSLEEDDFGWKEIGSAGRCVLSLPQHIAFDLKKDFAVPLLKRTGGNRKDNFKYTKDIVLSSSYHTGYMLGFFLGDGCANVAEYKNSTRGSVNWYINAEHAERTEKLRQAIKECTGKDAKISKAKSLNVVSLHYKPLANMLNSFGKKHEKHLPKEYLVSNPDYLKGLLDGMVDSDGHIEAKTGRVGFTNTSEQLMELFGVVSYLVHGKFPNFTAKSKSGGKNINVKNLKQAYAARQLKVNRSAHNTQLVKVLDTEPELLEVKVYDIEVDCPTHSFIANNAVVHNSMCTTRVVTGHGVPQLSAIEDCARIKVRTRTHVDYSGNKVKEYKAFPGISLIADGGIRSSGDIVKALAIGADAVMLGGLLAGTSDTPGETHQQDGQLYKYYHGMASEKGRSGYFDREKTAYVPEGESTRVSYKGATDKIVSGLVASLRVGMSYAGADNLAALRKNAQWRRVTGAGAHEGTPHGK